MIKIEFDRDSVYVGDDIENHSCSFEVDEKLSINEFINILHSKRYINCGREWPWLLQIKKDDNYYRNIALFAKEGKIIKILGSCKTIGEIVNNYKTKLFYAKFLAVENLEEAYNFVKN